MAVLVLAAMACALPALSAADRPPSTAPTSTASGGPGAGTGGGTGPHSTPSAMAIFEATSTRTSTPATHHRGHHGHHGAQQAQHANRTMGPGSGQRGRQRHKLDEGLEFDEMLASTPPLMCPICRLRDEMRRLSLDSIKMQILHKLNLQQAPNMTGRRLPKYEHITQLLDAQPLGLLGGGQGAGEGAGLGMGMQGDDPNASSFRPGPEVVEEEDDFHAKMERVIALPQTREYELSCITSS